LAVPAVVVAIALGVLISVLGPQPTTGLVLISIYLVSVTSLWVCRRGVRGQLSPAIL
jgi:ABC-type spermidine/putrescine transport system permease subunit II